MSVNTPRDVLAEFPQNRWAGSIYDFDKIVEKQNKKCSGGQYNKRFSSVQLKPGKTKDNNQIKDPDCNIQANS